MDLKISFMEHSGIISIWDNKGNVSLHIGVRDKQDWIFGKKQFVDMDVYGFGPLFVLSKDFYQTQFVDIEEETL